MGAFLQAALEVIPVTTQRTIEKTRQTRNKVTPAAPGTRRAPRTPRRCRVRASPPTRCCARPCRASSPRTAGAARGSCWRMAEAAMSRWWLRRKRCGLGCKKKSKLLAKKGWVGRILSGGLSPNILGLVGHSALAVGESAAFPTWKASRSIFFAIWTRAVSEVFSCISEGVASAFDSFCNFGFPSCSRVSLIQTQKLQ